jgi:pyruvate kinase
VQVDFIAVSFVRTADVITNLRSCLSLPFAVLLCCPRPAYVQVDFIAVSFVRTADVITNLRSYIETRTAPGGCPAAGSADNNSEPTA